MANYEVLTASQRRQLEQVVHELSADDIARYYTFSGSDLTLINRRKRKTRFGFAIQLCYLRYPGRPILDEEVIPDQLLLYVARQLQLPTRLIRDYGKQRAQTLDDHLDSLRVAFGFMVLDGVQEQELSDWLLAKALDLDDGYVLMTLLMEEMRQRQIVQPKLSRLEALVWEVIEQAKQSLYASLTGKLTERQRDQIRGLLTVRTERPLVTYLVWLRDAELKVKPINFQRLADRYQFIQGISLPANLDQVIPAHRLRQLARQGELLTPQHLTELADKEEQMATLVAYLLDKTVTLTDQALKLHDQLVGQMFNRSEKRQSRKLQRDGKQVNRILVLHRKIGQSVIQARTMGNDAFEAIEKVLTWQDYISSVDEAAQLMQDEQFDGLELVDRHYTRMRHYSPRLLDVFEFNGTEATRSLRDGIALLQARNLKDKPGDIPPDTPIEFVPPRWQPFVKEQDGKINHRYFELCLLSELRNKLRSGDVTVKRSRQFKDFEEYLIPLSLWEHMKQTNTVPLPIELDVDKYLAQRKQLLHEQLTLVNDLMVRGKLPGVTLKNGKLSFTRSPRADHADEAAALSEALYDLVPRIRMPELLAEVDEWTGFRRYFTHERTGDVVEDLAVLYAVILAEGINLGLTKMADASPKLKLQSLLTVHRWCIRDETYQKALIELVNYHHQLPFASYWGDGTTSASDGQFFLADKRAVLAQINKHYGFQPGVLLYTHHGDQHQPFRITVISPNDHEAPPMIDGVLYHQTDLDIQEHYTDTGGYSDHAFAVLHMVGKQFAPRIRDLNEKRLYCFEDPAQYPALAPWIADKINEKRIRQHWDEVLRMMCSIQTGTTTASLLMKRLAAYTRKNSLASAFDEIGHIEKSLFMLTWLQDPELRYRVFVGLEKIERKNTMADAVLIHRHGVIKDLSVEALLNRASGLNFLIMAIVIWNTVYLAHAVEVLRARGIEVPDHLLQHISPLAWEHVNLTGDYAWEKLLPKSPNVLRSLRLGKIKSRFQKAGR